MGNHVHIFDKNIAKVVKLTCTTKTLLCTYISKAFVIKTIVMEREFNQ